jgi:hypothetical protein
MASHAAVDESDSNEEHGALPHCHNISGRPSMPWQTADTYAIDSMGTAQAKLGLYETASSATFWPYLHMGVLLVILRHAGIVAGHWSCRRPLLQAATAKHDPIHAQGSMPLIASQKQSQIGPPHAAPRSAAVGDAAATVVIHHY